MNVNVSESENINGTEKKRFSDIIKYSRTVAHYGKIEKVVGTTIESIGPDVNVGDLCHIYPTR